MDEHDERLIELETRVAYQDKLLADLDEVVQVLAKQLDKAERKIRQLEATQQKHQEVLEPHNTPPPHY